MSTQVCKVQTAQPFFFLFIVKVFVFERNKLKFAVIIHIWYAATNCHIRAPLSLLPFSVVTATRIFINVSQNTTGQLASAVTSACNETYGRTWDACALL